MRSIYLFIFLAVALATSAQTAEERSVSFIKRLERQQFDSCFAMFDTVVANKFSANMLEQMWGSMPRYLGEYKGFTDVTSEQKDSIVLVYVLCAFEKMKINLQLAYKQTPDKIIGIFFIPPKSKTAYSPPEYIDSHKFYETKLAVTSGTMTLPGVLCMPNYVTNPPVVILIAGSGPSDKDETFGPNKPLKDIATGLATFGIATFRYDKRTLVYGKEISNNDQKFGLQEEVIDDVINAIAKIKAHSELKNSKIFIVGHSLGAMCAPWIASKSKSVNGIVLLAGNARPLEDVIVDQITYLASQDGIDEDEQKEIDTLKQQAATVKNINTLKKAEREDLPLKLTPYYWQTLLAYNQVEVAKKIKQPILVIQGERDYQVTMTDFNLWKEALAKQPKNKFTSYPDLNHLLLPGKEQSWPQEYNIPGHVPKELIEDVANWVKEQK